MNSEFDSRVSVRPSVSSLSVLSLGRTYLSYLHDSLMSSADSNHEVVGSVFGLVLQSHHQELQIINLQNQEED